MTDAFFFDTDLFALVGCFHQQAPSPICFVNSALWFVIPGISIIVENLLEQSRSLIRKRIQMIYRMTELNQFQRSKDRLTEMLYCLMKTTLDTHNDSYIRTIQVSIQTLDAKIEEFRGRVSDQRMEML